MYIGLSLFFCFFLFHFVYLPYSTPPPPPQRLVTTTTTTTRCCAVQGVRAAVQAGDLAEAATYVRRFREIDAGALADSSEMVDMDEAVKR